MAVRKTVTGGKGSLGGDRMRYVQKPDGTYLVTVTRHWLGGKQETFTYETRTLPLTAKGAWGQGARMHRQENMTYAQRRAESKRNAISLIVVVVIVGIVLIAMASTGHL